MTLAKLSATISAIGVLVGAVFAVDSFYYRKAEAADFAKDISAQLKRDREVAALASAQNKLSFLTAKKDKTEDDQNEIAFLRAEIIRLRAELQK